MLDPFQADDAAKTREQLIQELAELRQQLAAQQVSSSLFSQPLLLESFWAFTTHLDVAFWISSVEHFQVSYVSPSYEQIWGRTCASLYEQPWSMLEAVYESDRQSLQNVLEQANDCNFDLEHRILHTDGSQRWIRHQGLPISDASGQVVARAGIAQDITEKKHDK
ncbi:MAG TPA: PAS domain-containing protein, partial [Allocoleopsis sp.]